MNEIRIKIPVSQIIKVTTVVVLVDILLRYPVKKTTEEEWREKAKAWMDKHFPDPVKEDDEES